MTVSRKKHMCRCDAMGMPHKRNQICEDYHKKIGSVISIGEYNKKMAHIIELGLPIEQTFIRMLDVAARYTVVGVPVNNRQVRAQKKLDKLGIKSQKHILKAWDKKRGL